MENKNKKFLVVVQADYVDGVAILERPDGEFGGEGYVELKDSKEVVLGSYNAPSKEDAIEFAATSWEVSSEVLDAYEIR